MKRPITTTFCALQIGVTVTSFSVGDIHTHTAPYLTQPSFVQDSISNLVSINPASTLFEKYMSTLGNYPLPTKMVTGASLAVVGDAIAQGREDEEYNAARGASFAMFDSTYRAAQHFLFPMIVEFCKGQYLLSTIAAVGVTAEMFDLSSLAAMERSLASQLIIVPFFYYPVFFSFTAFMQGLDFDEGVQRAKDNFIPLMKRNLLFWIPVQYVQFAFVPTDLQIPFLSCAGLCWTFILSVLAGSAKKYSDDNPQHETYCVIGTEKGCVIPEEELFPVAFDDFDENIGQNAEKLNVPQLQLQQSSDEKEVTEESREVVLK